MIVTGKDSEFVGLITSWDVTREMSLDTKAWPWNRESPLFSCSEIQGL